MAAITYRILGWKWGEGIAWAAAMEKAQAKAIPRPISLTAHQLSRQSLYPIPALLITQCDVTYQYD
jgi:hypothetical protein